MKKFKLIIVTAMVIGLTASIFVATQASYGEKASKILKEISAKMKDFAKDKKALNNGTKSLKTLLEDARKRKKDAFNQLKKVAELNAQAKEMKFQFILQSVAEKWYSTTKKWYGALDGMQTKLESLGRDMTLIAENMKGLGEMAQKKKNEESN